MENGNINIMPTIKEKLIKKINDQLPHVPISPGDKIISYRGPKDAGQYSWTTLGFPAVCSSETMTDLLTYSQLCSTLPTQYRCEVYEIGGGSNTHF